MSVEIRSLNVPDALYQRIKARAERNHRSVEDELIEAAAAGITNQDDEDTIPPAVRAELSSLEQASDEALWQAARSHLPLAESDEIEELHLKQQRGEMLTLDEKQRLAALMHQYERYMLIRAKAAALLKRRGHDIDVLLEEP